MTKAIWKATTIISIATLLPWFPHFHPKNAKPLAHNNDANAPFEYHGVHHLFMQANFPGVVDWNGAIGLAHLTSPDLAHWRVGKPALLPGRWAGPIGTVGQPAGLAVGGYYSCSATLVDGLPRLIVPAVFFKDIPPITCADRDSWHCPLVTPAEKEACAMVYTYSTPANASDPYLEEWTEPVTVVDGRVDGVMPHTPSFDDTTHAWQDPEDKATDTWRFAGQTTVCRTPGCNHHDQGDRPTYLQLFASKNGTDWSQGFTALGDLFPFEPDGEPDGGIMNVPDFWKRDETGWPVDFLHFGSDAYWLGHYEREGPGYNQTRFRPSTPQQQFGPGAGEGHGYFSAKFKCFVWWGWIGGHPPSTPGVPAWDSMLTVARTVTYDAGLSTIGDFHGMLRVYPLHTLELLRGKLLLNQSDVLGRAAHPGVYALPGVRGQHLDIEINITWPDGAPVPADFGSVGVRVLAGPLRAAAAREALVESTPRVGQGEREAAHFDPVQHGSLVHVTESASGSLATWGPVHPGVLGQSCNEVAFIGNGSADGHDSYWVLLDPRMSVWVDVGWCSRSVDYRGGKAWRGPKPKWLGYQGANKAWLYRASGLFKNSSEPPVPPATLQGRKYGAAFSGGQNVSALRTPHSLEFFLDGRSQGKIPIDGLPADVVGCVAVCGGGSIVTGSVPFNPSPSPAPPASGSEFVITSGKDGAFALNRVPLAPAGSSRPRPNVLTLRVLVDGCAVEAFAQGGRATEARMACSSGADSALVWRDGGVGEEAGTVPQFSVKVWSMNSAWIE